VLSKGVGSFAIQLDAEIEAMIFSGAPNPADPSRFSFVVGAGRKRFDIDAALEADGHVRLSPRGGTVTEELQAESIRVWTIDRQKLGAETGRVVESER
jgi:hypothetical protein